MYSVGVCEIISANTLEITELPIGMATDTFISRLSEHTDYIKEIRNISSGEDIKVLVHFKPQKNK